MKKILIMTLVLLMGVTIVYAKQPEVKSAKLEPVAAAPGDNVKLTVELTGKPEEIKEVSLIVREYPYDFPRQYLTPPKDAKLNAWILEAEIPYDAPYETVNLDITVKDKEGKVIIPEVLKKEGKTYSASVKLTIQ